jgi:hypothetical protein
MNNINRRQQIPVAFNTEKAMTYGAAIKSSKNRDIELSNLNRMSMATNPWTRKIAQGELSYNWVDYQNQLIAKASGTEALTQLQKAKPTALQQRDIQAIDYSLDSGADLSGLYPAFSEAGSVYSGEELGDIYPYGGGGGGGIGEMEFASDFLRGVQRELGEQAGGGFSLGEALEAGRQYRGEMARGARSVYDLPEVQEAGFAENLAQIGQMSSEEILGAMSEGGMGFISREQFAEALEAERRGRQDILRHIDPTSLIYLAESDVLEQIEDLGRFERESLEQGVEQDFDSRDISLTRINKFMTQPEIQNLPSLGSNIEQTTQQVGFALNKRSRVLGKRFGLPEFQLAAEVEGLRQTLEHTTKTMQDIVASEVLGGGVVRGQRDISESGGEEAFERQRTESLELARQYISQNPIPSKYDGQPIGKEKRAQLEQPYYEWLVRNIMGYGRVPQNAFQQFMKEQSSSMF